MVTERGIMTRAMDQMRQFMCGLHGHDALLHFEQGRISLQCTSCGYETPGWDLKGSHAHAASARQNPLRGARVVQMPLVGERRVA